MHNVEAWNRIDSADEITSDRQMPNEHPYDFDIPLQEVREGVIHQFNAYWRSKAVDGQIPSRNDLNPLEFRGLLPNIFMVDLEYNPFRVRYRLCGTTFTQFFGEQTNRYLDERENLTPHLKATYTGEHEFVVAHRRPVFTRNWVVLQNGIKQYFFSGIWPLSTDGTLIDKCIAVDDYLEIVPWDVLFASRTAPQAVR